MSKLSDVQLHDLMEAYDRAERHSVGLYDVATLAYTQGYQDHVKHVEAHPLGEQVKQFKDLLARLGRDGRPAAGHGCRDRAPGREALGSGRRRGRGVKIHLGSATEGMNDPRGRVEIYPEPRDAWIGVYVATDAVYVCPIPFLVVRISRGR